MLMYYKQTAIVVESYPEYGNLYDIVVEFFVCFFFHLKC